MTLCLFFIVSLSGCSKREENVSDKFKIVASFYPVHNILLNLIEGTENVSLDVIATETTGCLHDFQLGTDDMKIIEKSDAFVINGAGMEEFLDNVLEECKHTTIIDSSQGTNLIEECHHHEHHHHHKHEHHEHDECKDHHKVNSHIWLSINNYVIQVENISNELARLNPQNAEVYLDNARRYKDKLLFLKSNMQKKLIKISNRNIITFHEAFPYFAREFGLNVVTSINREPNSDPSAKDLVKIIKKIKKTGVKSLFAEPQYPKTSASILADETGATIYELDPIVSGPFDKDAYIEAMKKNVDVLVQALS